MLRDEMVAEISMRRDIPMETVEEVLEEQDEIFDEECKCRKKKKCIISICFATVFIMGAAFALYILDKKEKIDMQNTMKKYMEKIKSMEFKKACKDCC
ncbi:MAG: hypothetical protein K2H07_07400 [Lachnospiraceae bacterium]|nr:hypothetical protein [Lachnospiraceae bacterium]